MAAVVKILVLLYAAACAAVYTYLSGWERGFDAARELFEPGATG